MSPTPAPLEIVTATVPSPSPLKGWKSEARNQRITRVASTTTAAATPLRRPFFGRSPLPESDAASRRASASQSRSADLPSTRDARSASRARRAASRSSGVRPPGTGGGPPVTPPPSAPGPTSSRGDEPPPANPRLPLPRSARRAWWSVARRAAPRSPESSPRAPRQTHARARPGRPPRRTASTEARRPPAPAGAPPRVRRSRRGRPRCPGARSPRAAWRSSPSGPRSRGRSEPRRGPGRGPSPQRVLDLDARGGQRVWKPVRIDPAGLRHGVPATTAAARRLRRGADHVTGPEALLHRSLGEVRHEVRLAVGGGSEHHRRVAELLAHGVGEREHLLGPWGVHLVHDHTDPRARPCLLDESVGQLAVEFLLRLLLPLLRLLHEPLHGPHDLVLWHAEHRGDLLDPAGSLLEQLRPRRAGQRFDPAHIGRARGLGRHLEDPDLGGRGRMGAAAELTRDLLYLDHADPIAVLLSEQRHRTEGLRLGPGRLDGVDGATVRDPAVHQGLHVGELFVAQPLAVSEVEAQLVG